MTLYRLRVALLQVLYDTEHPVDPAAPPSTMSGR